MTAFFHSDDLDLLWFVSKDGPLGMWRNTPQDYFRPLVSVNLWAEWHLWGPNPLGYHLTHCLIHAVNSLLIFFLGRKLEFPAIASVAAALLFLVLPGHSESVAWMGDRASLLATLFTLLALLVFFGARNGSRRGAAALILCCIMALLSKEAAVLLPVFVAVFHAMRPGTQRSAGIRWVVWLSLLLPVYFLARWLYVGSVFGGPSGTPRVSVFYVAWGLLRALPATLCPMTTSSTAFLLAALSLVAVGASLCLRTDKTVRRDVCLLLLAFYAAVLPVSWTSLAPPLWGYDTRALYLPSAFSCLAMARLLGTLRFAPALTAALFLLFSLQSFVIFREWNKAGEWVRSGLATMASFPPCKRRIVMVTPDIRYPAWVFRRGMGAGLHLFYGNAPKEVLSLAPTVFYNEKDRVEISPESDGVSVTLHYAMAPIKRTPVIEIRTGLPLALKTSDPPTFHLTLPEPRPGDQFVYFSEGRFHLWNR